MESGSETERFIVTTFQSVWTLELLLLLKSSADRHVSRSELVDALRASEAIVAKGVEALLAAGLVIEEEAGVRYVPASADLALRADEAEQLYKVRPDAVHRLIIRRSPGGLAAFADAFLIRGNK